MKNKDLYENIPQRVSPVKVIIYDEMFVPNMRLHWHEQLEMHYMLEGKTTVRCENEMVEISEGECLIINSNEFHENRNGGMCRYMAIIFPPSFAPQNNIILKRKIKDSEITKLVERIIFEHQSGDENKDIAITGYACLLLTHLYRNHIYEEIEESKYKAYAQKMVMCNEIIEYIRENYMQDLTLVDIADKFHISQYYLCRIFKEFTNKTLKEYINEIRIKKAQELLCTVNCSISEIASMCGFNDPNYFSRKFKQITGKTPRQMRDLK